MLILVILALMGQVSTLERCEVLSLANGKIRQMGKGALRVRFACNRGYQLVGNRYSYCIRGSWDSPVPLCLKPGCSRDRSKFVNGNFYESYRGAQVTVICEPGYRVIGSNTVYCDGRSWNGTFPKCVAEPIKPQSFCDLRNGWCGWSEGSDNDADWKNVYHPEGHRLEADLVNKSNAASRIYSPVFYSDASENICFSFGYLINVSSSGEIRVYVKLEERTIENTIPTFWFGQQDGHFEEAFINIEPIVGNFQVVIEAVNTLRQPTRFTINNLKVTTNDECILLSSTVTTEISSESTSTEMESATGEDFWSTTEESTTITPFTEEITNTETEIVTDRSTPSTQTALTTRTSTLTTRTQTPKLTTSKLYFTTPDRRRTIKVTEFRRRLYTTTTTMKPRKTIFTPKNTIGTSTIRKIVTTPSPAVTSTIRKNITTFLPPTVSKITTRLDAVDSFRGINRTNDWLKTYRKQNISQGEATIPSFTGVRLNFVLVVSSCTAIAILIITSVVVFEIRRRKRNQEDNLPEDSDVRYLTYDELLDFTLAKPADDDL